jgi:hypothetical protein
VIPFLIDIHGHLPGARAAEVTAATETFLETLRGLGVSFDVGDSAFNLATVRHGWLCSRQFWEQDPVNGAINHRRNESIQVTVNLLTGRTEGRYELLHGR